MLSLFLVLSIQVLAPDSPGSELRRVRAMQELASESFEVVQTYEALASEQKDKATRMRAYGELPSSMKASVWRHQLLTALAEHPEFTDEQRTVLYDALDVFRPDFFEITFGSRDWSARVDEPLRKLSQRAKAAFGPVGAGRLLAQLGSYTAVPDAQRETGAPHSGKLRPAPSSLPNCSCSTTSDFCASEFGPDWYCLGGGCIWGTNWGCGAVFAYRCDGLCDLRKFQN